MEAKKADYKGTDPSKKQSNGEPRIGRTAKNY
jgi:hypothetical protein